MVHSRQSIALDFSLCRLQCPAQGRMLEEDPRSGTRVASPQHNRWSISQYLPYVNYYLVGTIFETSTRREKEENPKTHPHKPRMGHPTSPRRLGLGHPPTRIQAKCCAARRAARPRFGCPSARYRPEAPVEHGIEGGIIPTGGSPVTAEHCPKKKKRKAPQGVATNKLVFSAYQGSNDGLFPHVLSLYVAPGSTVADVTMAMVCFGGRSPRGHIALKRAISVMEWTPQSCPTGTEALTVSYLTLHICIRRVVQPTRTTRTTKSITETMSFRQPRNERRRNTMRLSLISTLRLRRRPIEYSATRAYIS